MVVKEIGRYCTPTLGQKLKSWANTEPANNLKHPIEKEEMESCTPPNASQRQAENDMAMKAHSVAEDFLRPVHWICASEYP